VVTRLVVVSNTAKHAIAMSNKQMPSKAEGVFLRAVIASSPCLSMPLMVTTVMADRQIVLMAAAAFTQRLNVLQRGIGMRHMLPANPTRHRTMQLARYRFVDLVAGELETTQSVTSSAQSGTGHKRQSL
jgi:hypothetical protein